jgi:hypothetical protein
MGVAWFIFLLCAATGITSQAQTFTNLCTFEAPRYFVSRL